MDAKGTSKIIKINKNSAETEFRRNFLFAVINLVFGSFAVKEKTDAPNSSKTDKAVNYS